MFGFSNCCNIAIKAAILRWHDCHQTKNVYFLENYVLLCFRFLEWMNCCCGGYDDENIQGNGGGDDRNHELLYPFSSIPPCRDFMFQHPRNTPNCHLLADLPSSIPLDSGYV